jgi:hypothetical protein
VGTGDSGEGLNPHQEIIAEFEKANPDILVQLEAVSGVFNVNPVRNCFLTPLQIPFFPLGQNCNGVNGAKLEVSNGVKNLGIVKTQHFKFAEPPQELRVSRMPSPLSFPRKRGGVRIFHHGKIFMEIEKGE